MSNYKFTFRMIALVLSLAILVQVAPMRIFVSAEEVSLDDITVTEDDVINVDDTSQIDSAAVEIVEDAPLTVVGEVESLRDESVKHFRMSDGSFMAVSYGMPVHYQDESGEWQDIDNSMVLTEDQNAYQAENAGIATTFSTNLNSGNVFSTSHNGTSVSMSILDTSQAKNIISANQTISTMSTATAMAVPQAELTFDRTAVADIEVEAPTVLNPGTTGGGWTAEDVMPKNLQSSVLYEDVFPGIDLMYTAYSFNIKEEIIVKQPQASYRYDFMLELDGVTASLNEDGSISLLNDADEELYSIPAPFMQDSNGMVSYDVEYILTNTSSGVILTVVADADWMNAEERIFPVSIDPTLIVQNGTSEDEIYISYVASGTPTTPYTGSNIYFGYTPNNNVGEYRTFLHFSNLPDVPTGAIVTEAQLGMYMHTYTQANCSELAACVFEVNQPSYTTPVQYYNWINGLTWATMPEFNSNNMLDYEILSQAKLNDYANWDITEAAKDWYTDNDSNSTPSGTIVIKIVDGACSNSSYAQPVFYGTASTSAPPMLYVKYRSSLGIEPYYTYNTMGVGGSGVAYIADNSGQLKIVKELASYASTVNPVSLSMVYNSDYFMADNEKNYQPMIDELELTISAGTGWRLDCVQHLSSETIDGKTYLKYIDGDGTIHYFSTDSEKEPGTYYDEDGLGLEIITNPEGGHIMYDDQDNKWYFNQWGFFNQYVDNNGNQTVLYYPNSKLQNIQQINVGQSAITVAAFSYDGDHISSITDAAGNVLTFGYSGEFLTSLQYNGVTIAVYDYTGRRIYRLHDSESGYNIHMTYDSAGRISGYKENDGTNDGAMVDITYAGFTKTTYNDYGADRNQGTADDIYAHYLFDYAGRTVNTSTTDYQGEVWGASTAVYSGIGTTDKTNNRTLRSADMNVMGMQYMRNGGLESDSTASDLVWSFGSGASRSDTKPHTGYFGIKGTQSLGTSTPIATKANAAPLSAGYTYTLSAYVNTSEATTVHGKGIYATMTDSAGNVYTTNAINYKTFATADGGWTRISVSIPCTVTSTFSLKIYADGVTGNFYLDDFFVEYRDIVTDVNLLENGFAQFTTYGWTLGSHAVFAGGLGANVTDNYAICFKMMGVPLSSVSTFYQDVPINLPGTETFVLSGWGLINAVPDDQPDRWIKKCGLIGTIFYADKTTEDFYAPFDADVQEQWQFTSVIIVPTHTDKTIDFIRVTGTYQGNANDSYFDSLSLIRQSYQTMHYDDDGNLVSVRTNGLQEDTNTYSDGNLMEVVTGGNGTYEYTYESTYDSTIAHRLKSVTNGLITQSYGYDGSGNVTSTELSGSGSKKLQSSATYGGNKNRLVTVTDSSGSTTSYAYGTEDCRMWGVPSSSRNANDVLIAQTYDDFGRLKKTVLASTAAVQYTYSDGNLTRVTRGNTPAGTTQTYSMAYDGFGNMTSLNVGEYNLATYTYEAQNGLLKKLADGNENETFYTYDFLGRLVTALDSEGKGLKYTYNGDGQLSSIEEAGYEWNVNWKNTYDSLGRLTATAQYHEAYILYVGAYRYNENNQLTDEQWRLMNGATYASSYTYNAADGSLATVTYPVGQISSYNYDGLRRLSSISNGIYTKTYGYRDISDTRTTTQVQTLAYTGLEVPLTYTYTYDALGNISTISDPLVGSRSYTYDNQGQMLTETIGSTTYTYTYDTVGNILTANNLTGSHTYTYGDAEWRDLLTAYDGVGFTYDGAGNPLTYYNGTSWTFTWGKQKRLETATTGGNTINFYYTEDGLRTSKYANGVYYHYIYNGGKLMRMYTDDVTMDFIYDAQGQPFAMIHNGRILYYVLNLQGDVVRLVDSDGESFGVYRYDAWGNIIYASDNQWINDNPLRYRGYVYDTETKLYYCQSRYYDPAIGRFLNADSFASTGQGFIGYNMFAYCGNNPVNFSDQSGKFAEKLGEQLGEWLYELFTDKEHPNKQIREQKKQIISAQHRQVSTTANLLWNNYIHSVEMQAHTQYQQDMMVISNWEDTVSNPVRLGDFANMVFTNATAYCTYASIASASAVTFGSVLFAGLTVGAALWSTLRYYDVIPELEWEDFLG